MPTVLPMQRGSHHGDTRLIRHAYGEGERYVPLVLRAQTLWDELAKLTEERIFERTGIINRALPALIFWPTLSRVRKRLILMWRSWTRQASWPVGQRSPSRTIISACLKPTPGSYTVKRPSKPDRSCEKRLRSALQLSGGIPHSSR